MTDTVPTLSFAPLQRTTDVGVDLTTLVETRMLILGTSGAGKTTLLFQLLQETYGRVQHIVIDKEGQFSKLRERYDYLLAGPGGEAPIELRPGHAEVLLRKVLELQTNVIFDLSETTPDRQREYVARLAREMAHMPVRSALAEHMRLVVVDEIQHYAPEAGKGSATSTEPMVELGSLGRKRGFCLVGATLRLSQVSKGLTELLDNKLIGRIGATDAKRAGEELDFDKAGRKELRSLPTGQFYAYGPAIALDPVLVSSNSDLQVRPRRRGEMVPPPPPTPASLQTIVAALAELPLEADAEARTIEELRALVKDLKTKLTRSGKGDAPSIDQAALDRAVRDAVTSDRARFIAELKRLVSGELSSIATVIASIQQHGDVWPKLILDLHRAFAGLSTSLEPQTNPTEESRAEVQVGNHEQGTGANHPSVSTVGQSSRAPARPIVTSSGDVSPGMLKLLESAARLRALGVASASRAVVAVLAGVSTTSSTTEGNFGALIRQGYLVATEKGKVSLTGHGVKAAPRAARPATLREYHDAWRATMGASERKLFDVMVSNVGRAASRAWFAERAGISSTSSTTEAAFGWLATIGLFQRAGTGEVKAGPLFYPEGLR